MDVSKYKKVDLDHLTQSEMEAWNIGDTLLLSGTIITGRDTKKDFLTLNINAELMTNARAFCPRMPP